MSTKKQKSPKIGDREKRERVKIANQEMQVSIADMLRSKGYIKTINVW